MLIFPLKKEWYEKIRSGEKRIEYREVKPYWTKRLYKWCKSQWRNINKEFSVDFPVSYTEFDKYGTSYLIGDEGECVYLQLGYNQKTRLSATLFKIEVVDGRDTDLAIDKPVYAIHLADVREVKE